jgi:hypothetical protein
VGGEVSDLVKRLSKEGPFVQPYQKALFHEAADELARLRAENAELRTLLVEARDKVEWIGCSEEGYNETIKMRDEFIKKLDAAIDEAMRKEEPK